MYLYMYFVLNFFKTLFKKTIMHLKQKETKSYLDHDSKRKINNKHSFK